MSGFAFGTKAETLARLSGRLTRSYVLPLVGFPVSEWKADPAAVLARIGQAHVARTVIVRSAAANEDGAHASNAGAHLSIPHVDASDVAALAVAIDAVIRSYRAPAPGDQVMVQEELSGVKLAGVLFCREIGTAAPYRVFNYDDTTARTDTVTGGRGQDLRTYVRMLGAAQPYPSEELALVFRAAEEVEAIAGDAVELELAVDREGRVCLFQARPLVVTEPTAITDAQLTDWLTKAAKKVEKLSRPHPHLAGERSVFGVMPDWNPAEIIGVKPRTLALTLYKEIITDSIWAYMRDNYGYRNLRSFPLLVSILGVPYIDVRVSFNSFVPKGIREPLVARLVNHYVERLVAAPRCHDKVEFDIVFSCYYPGIGKDAKRLTAAGFSGLEVGEILAALRLLTAEVIHPTRGLWCGDLAKIEKLKERRKQVLGSGMSTVDTIYWLLEDCKRYGTLPFSGLARAGFIAVQFLRGLVTTGALTQAQYEAFLGSLDTVANRITSDLARMRSGAIAREEFLAEYGHLRPGTYEITSPRYDEDFDRYYKAGEIAAQATHEHTPFVLDAATEARMERLLADEGFDVTARELFAFCKSAIEGREYAKHVFTRNLSDALVHLEKLGRQCGLARDDLSHLSVRTVLDLYSMLDAQDLREVLLRDIQANRDAHAMTRVVRLPELILAPDDVFHFHLGHAEPNFITSRRVEAEVVVEEDLFSAELAGKVVVLRAADPGYDWIFAKKIAGLVTQFGGANSHMAIRAAEQGIPAVIGAGEQNYRLWARARCLAIDCACRTVKVLR